MDFFPFQPTESEKSVRNVRTDVSDAFFQLDPAQTGCWKDHSGDGRPFPLRFRRRALRAVQAQALLPCPFYGACRPFFLWGFKSGGAGLKTGRGLGAIPFGFAFSAAFRWLQFVFPSVFRRAGMVFWPFPQRLENGQFPFSGVPRPFLCGIENGTAHRRASFPGAFPAAQV